MARIISTGRTLFSPENYERKKKEKKRKVLAWSVSILVLFIALVLVSRIENLQIKQVEVQGAKVVTEEEISRVTLNTLSEKYFWLVPKSNIALYPRDEVSKNLMASFPRISSVSFSLAGTSELLASVAEREPFALYCPELDTQCFFLDESGFIFDEAPDFSGVVYFIYSKDSPIENPEGSEFLPQDIFAPLANFVESLSKLGFEPVSLKIVDRDAELITRSGARMIFNAYGDLDFLHSNLEAFLNSPEIKADENFVKKVKSLDLRTENKVFYRFDE